MLCHFMWEDEKTTMNDKMNHSCALTHSPTALNRCDGALTIVPNRFNYKLYTAEVLNYLSFSY